MSAPREQMDTLAFDALGPGYGVDVTGRDVTVWFELHDTACDGPPLRLFLPLHLVASIQERAVSAVYALTDHLVPKEAHRGVECWTEERDE